MLKLIRLCALSLAAVGTMGVAAERVAVHPVQVGQETVRFRQGVATVDLWSETGAVQVTPLPMYRGSLAFSVTVFNGGDQPINFGTQNLTVEVGGTAVGIFPREELERRAEGRSRFRQFLVAFGGAMAASSAGGPSHYSATTFGPYGTYHTTLTGPPTLAGVLEAHSIRQDTSLRINSLQARLDQTRAQLADEIVQLSTVDAGQGYSGTIVLHRVRGRYPYNVRLTVNLNGQAYPFEFLVGRPGTAAPTFNRITPAEPPAALLARMNIAAAESPKLEPEIAQNSYVPVSRPVQLAQTTSLSPDQGGLLRSANTTSGSCINAGPDYRGSGSRSRPAVTSARPLCSSLAN